jgi:cysteine-rich repeat protein
MLVMASAAACGDNIVDMPDEECDDGNVFTGDGCSGKCKTERMSTSCHPRILSFPAVRFAQGAFKTNGENKHFI